MAAQKRRVLSSYYYYYLIRLFQIKRLQLKYQIIAWELLADCWILAREWLDSESTITRLSQTNLMSCDSSTSPTSHVNSSVFYTVASVYSRNQDSGIQFLGSLYTSNPIPIQRELTEPGPMPQCPYLNKMHTFTHNKLFILRLPIPLMSACQSI